MHWAFSKHFVRTNLLITTIPRGQVLVFMTLLQRRNPAQLTGREWLGWGVTLVGHLALEAVLLMCTPWRAGPHTCPEKGLLRPHQSEKAESTHMAILLPNSAGPALQQSAF